MRTIWKYELKGDRMIQLDLPEGAKMLTVQIQNDLPCLWVELDTEKPLQKRTFCIYSTGQQLPDDATRERYINTFQYISAYKTGHLVFHVYEVFHDHGTASS